MSNITIPNLPPATAITGPEMLMAVQGGTSVSVTAQQLAALALPLIFAPGLSNYANDAAAAIGGIPVNGLYRNGSVVMIRVT